MSVVRVTVNEVQYEREVPARRSLAEFLREDLGLTGTHVGCEHGVCGACTVLLEGKSVRSCLLFAVQTNGRSVTTIEGASTQPPVQRLQAAFRKCHALQCGFCTPGMIISASELLAENDHPTEQEVREWLSGQLCMCTGYAGIVNAVMQAASDGAPGGSGEGLNQST
jgi:aerobic-type carbon monoxide dehydrogenase small subunit (CoxS/CutS family)